MIVGVIPWLAPPQPPLGPMIIIIIKCISKNSLAHLLCIHTGRWSLICSCSRWSSHHMEVRPHTSSCVRSDAHTDHRHTHTRTSRQYYYTSHQTNTGHGSTGCNSHTRAHGNPSDTHTRNILHSRSDRRRCFDRENWRRGCIGYNSYRNNHGNKCIHSGIPSSSCKSPRSYKGQGNKDWNVHTCRHRNRPRSGTGSELRRLSHRWRRARTHRGHVSTDPGTGKMTPRSHPGIHSGRNRCRCKKCPRCDRSGWCEVSPWCSLGSGRWRWCRCYWCTWQIPDRCTGSRVSDPSRHISRRHTGSPSKLEMTRKVMEMNWEHHFVWFNK